MKKKKQPRCLNCGKRLIEVVDSIAKKKTGYLFRCKCMPDRLISFG